MATLKEHQEVLYELLTELDRICKKNDINYMLFAGTMLGAVRHKGFIPWDDDLDVVMLREDYERFINAAQKDIGEKYFLQSEFSENWPMFFSKLRKNGTTCLEKYHPKNKNHHQGIYIDIFPCDNLSNNKLCKKFQFISSRVVCAKGLFKRGYDTDSRFKRAFMTLCRPLPNKLFHKMCILKSKNNTEFVHTFLAASSNMSKSIFPRRWFDQTIPMEFEKGVYPVSAHFDELLTTLYGDYMKIPDQNERSIKVHALLVDTQKNYTEYENYRDSMSFSVKTRSIR